MDVDSSGSGREPAAATPRPRIDRRPQARQVRGSFRVVMERTGGDLDRRCRLRARRSRPADRSRTTAPTRQYSGRGSHGAAPRPGGPDERAGSTASPDGGLTRPKSWEDTPSRSTFLTRSETERRTRTTCGSRRTWSNASINIDSTAAVSAACLSSWALCEVLPHDGGVRGSATSWTPALTSPRCSRWPATCRWRRRLVTTDGVSEPSARLPDSSTSPGASAWRRSPSGWRTRSSDPGGSAALSCRRGTAYGSTMSSRSW